VRIEAIAGPVTLLLEREKTPKAGETFRVAVFVADKAMGTQRVTYEQWAEFCQCCPTVHTS
jgi:hypothetical protein